MLCKIPLDASPACYRVPAMSGRSIVAVGNSSVFAEVQLLIQGEQSDPRAPLFATHLQRFDVP